MAAVQLETRRALRASNCTSVQRRDAAASIPEFAAVRQLPVRSLDPDSSSQTTIATFDSGERTHERCAVPGEFVAKWPKRRLQVRILSAQPVPVFTDLVGSARLRILRRVR